MKNTKRSGRPVSTCVGLRLWGVKGRPVKLVVVDPQKAKTKSDEMNKLQLENKCFVRKIHSKNLSSISQN